MTQQTFEALLIERYSCNIENAKKLFEKECVKIAYKCNRNVNEDIIQCTRIAFTNVPYEERFNEGAWVNQTRKELRIYYRYNNLIHVPKDIKDFIKHYENTPQEEISTDIVLILNKYNRIIYHTAITSPVALVDGEEINLIENIPGEDSFHLAVIYRLSGVYAQEEFEMDSKIKCKNLLVLPIFTEEEKTILQLLIEGNNQSQIARKMGVTPATITNKMNKIKDKIERSKGRFDLDG